MKNFVLMIFMLVLSSCMFGEIESEIYSGADGIWRGPSYGKHLSGTVYAAGLDYPDGYDWRADPEKGKVKCSLTLLADGVPVLRIPVGDAYEVSSDKNAHRILDGYLYTDYTDGNTTVIKKDGIEAVRYEGAEEISSMKIHNGVIHTLGSPKGGEGFTYRADGQVLVERESGTILSGLCEYGGLISFCFAGSAVSSSGPVSRYYLVSGGKVHQAAIDSDVTQVLDMGLYGGEMYLLAETDSVKSPVLIKGQERMKVSYFSRLDLVSCRFMETDSVCVRVRYRISGTMADLVWSGNSGFRRFLKGGLVDSIIADSEGCIASVYSADFKTGAIYSRNGMHYIPEGYRMYGDGCLAVRDTLVHAALTSDVGGRPVIWMNEILDTLAINGPLTCLQ